MKKSHMKKYFLDWNEKELSQLKMEAIDKHLKTCATCKIYFDKMQLFLEKPEPTAIPELQPDPFLPTRIKQKDKPTGSRVTLAGLLRARFRLTFGTAMIIFALISGVFLGKWISGNGAISETEIVLSYTSMFSNQGVGELWNKIITEKDGEQQ